MLWIVRRQPIIRPPIRGPLIFDTTFLIDFQRERAGARRGAHDFLQSHATRGPLSQQQPTETIVSNGPEPFKVWYYI